jgi:uncharacterized protein YjdB
MNKRFRYITYILASIALISAVFLTKDKIAEAANRVYLNETNLTLETGHYRTLKVYGTNQRATFKSANSRAATVSSSGRITARGWGSTTVYTYVGNKTLRTKVTIVQMNRKNVGLTPGKTSQLTLWGSNNSTTWKSNNNKVATVSDNGLVTAVSNGTATITATFNGKNITSKITVLGLNHDSAVLEYGGRFSATRPNYGSKVKLKVEGTKDKATWSSNNTSVATVDSNGKVTARGYGKAMITATVNGSSVSTEIRVLEMQSSELELTTGENYSLSVLGTNSDIKWRTLNSNVVTVDDNGLITEVGAGTTKVIAEVDGKQIRSIITVK